MSKPVTKCSFCNAEGMVMAFDKNYICFGCWDRGKAGKALKTYNQKIEDAIDKAWERNRI